MIAPTPAPARQVVPPGTGVAGGAPAAAASPSTPRTYVGADGLQHDQFGATYGATALAAGTINGATGKQAPGTPPASEPAVISSSTISDKIIPQNNDRLTSFAQKGTTVGQDGVMTYADGSAVPAPIDATHDGTTYVGTNGQKYAAPAQTTATATDPEMKQINDMLASMRSSLDASTLSYIGSIHTQFDQLKADQADANSRNEQGRAQALLIGGASRYAPLSAGGIMLAQTSYGLRQIADLDAKENAAIATAQKAQQDGDMKLMDVSLKLVEQTRTAKINAAAKLSATLQKANQKSADAKLQASRDSAVADLISGGVKDPAAIMKALNTYDDGSDTGAGFTLKEIGAALTNLKPKGVSTDLYKFTNADVGKLLGAGLKAPDIQAISNYYNGRADGTDLKLTPAQQAAVQSVLVKPTKSGAGGNKTYSSGSLSYTGDTLSKTQSWLNATKGPDKYVDPNAYQQAFDSWTGDGGLAKDFLAKFPPKTLVNPTNDWLPKYLQSKTTTAAKSSLSSQINSLFPSK